MGQPGMVPTGQNGLLDEEAYNRARQQQSQMGLWAGLLAGGAPSLSPTNFGAALGKGLLGMQQTGNQFDESQLYRAKMAAARAEIPKTKAEIDKLQREGKILDATADAMKRILDGGGIGVGGPTAMPGVAAPAGGMAAGGALTGGGGRGGWGPLAPVAAETLAGQGLSLAATQGILANGLGEGGFNAPWVQSGIQSKSGREQSFGHWQFNAGGELPGYQKWAEGKGDLQDTRLQAQFVAKRMEELHPGFSQITDPKLATDLVATKFERYQGAKPGQRYGLLSEVQRALGGGGPAGTQPAVLPDAGQGGVGILPLSGMADPAPVPPIAQAPLPPGIQRNSRGEPYNLGPAPGQQIPASAVGPAQMQQMAQAQAVPPRAGEPTPGDVAAINAAAMQRLPPLGGAPPVPGLMAGGAMQQPPPAAPALPAPAIPPIAQAPQAAPAAPPIAMPAQQPRPMAPPPMQAQIPGGISPDQVRAAQAASMGMSVLGKTVPGFINDTAGLPLAGAKAGAEAAARLPYQMQQDANKAALDRANELAKQQEQQRLDIGKAGPIASAEDAARRTSDQKEYDSYVRQEMGAGRMPLSQLEYTRAVRQAGATNITQKVEGQGQAKMVEFGIKQMEGAFQAEDDAQKRTQVYGQMAEAMKGFTPGATADLQRRAGAILKDLGVTTGASVSSAETFQQAAQKLQLAAAPKGQGSVSNYERELYAKASPQLISTPEALGRMIQIGVRLDDYDRKVAQIHRDVARDNGGLPNPLEAQQRVRDLGPRLSASETAALEALQKPASSGAAPVGAGRFRWDPARGVLVPE